MLVNGGAYNGQRFLSRTTTELLTVSNQSGTLFGGEGGPEHFSLGFSVVNPIGHDRGLGSVGKFKWGGYFNTNYFADPQEKIVAVLMKQTRDVGGDDSEATFVRMIYQALDDQRGRTVNYILFVCIRTVARRRYKHEAMQRPITNWG